MNERNIYKDILFGVAVGDALGVPVEFMSREEIAQEPIVFQQEHFLMIAL